MTITTINDIEYVDFRARFVAVSSAGRFEFRVLDEPGADPLQQWSLARSVIGQEPPAGYFSLPAHDGRPICPNVHTVRLRLGYARARGIL